MFMMQEEKRRLLIRDLSARLLYGVMCEVRFKDSEGWKKKPEITTYKVRQMDEFKLHETFGR